MPLDTSTYDLALLRVDGRRWNELRRLHGQIRTQAAADGSSYLEMGNTKVMCVITGPSEDAGKRRGGLASSSSAATVPGGSNGADVVVSIVVGGFSSVDRKRRGRGDKYVLFSLLRLLHMWWTLSFFFFFFLQSEILILFQILELCRIAS